jgi:hypothetical protein
MTLSSADTNELVSVVAGPISGAGSAFYFHPDTLAKGKELGLGGMKFYFLGRGGVLGDVHSDVIASAFGYFNRETAASLWDSAKEKVAPRDAGSIYFECAATFGRTALSDIEGLEAYNEAAQEVIVATKLAGLALFAGYAAEPLVEDTPGRAMQLTAVLRELRGSAHLVALLATGITPEHAHCRKRPEMAAGFGWDPAPDTSALTEELVETAERLTDSILVPSFGGLTTDQAAALEAGAEAIGSACSA